METTIDKCKDTLEDVVAYMASYGSAFPNELYANHKYSEICYAIRMLEKIADKADYEERLAVKEGIEND